MKDYLTIKEAGSFEIEIKKSRFITQMTRVRDENEALAFIDQIKKEHWKATHNCSAYTIGENDDIQRADDDGEPSGTAGLPMLEILKKRELKNVVAVVTRYFGGTKLGAGGLIRAYGGAVNETVKHLGVVERKRQLRIDITVDYPQSGRLENILRESSYILEEMTYAEHVTFHCVVPITERDQFLDRMTEWTSDNFEYVVGDPAWIELDVPINH